MEHKRIDEIIKKQRDFFNSRQTLDISFRLDGLRKLKEAIKKHEEALFKAHYDDFGKSRFETFATEIGQVYEEIHYHIKNLKKWSKPKKVKTPIVHFFSRSRIIAEPYGLTLIISPWNYPFNLSITPLVGAISAGNCCVLKPANYSHHVSEAIKAMIEDTFSEEYISVFSGGREVNQALLEKKYDYIFFTGSPGLGRIVMEKASEHLTPLTLELGGKSPCIIHKDANIDLAAKRAVWGKLVNAGQTCVAPDYFFIHSDIKEQVLEAMKKYIRQFYGDDPALSPDFPRIINDRQFERVSSLLEGEKIIEGGVTDPKTRYIAPTIIDNPALDSQLMTEEIFGPVIPVLPFTHLDEVISFISARPKPLAFYLFTSSKAVEERFVREISFGGGSINDTLIQNANPNLPFGGVGSSGMGRYHGKFSFDTFSHYKGVTKKTTLFDINIRYAPYKDKIKILRKLFK